MVIDNNIFVLKDTTTIVTLSCLSVVVVVLLGSASADRSPRLLVPKVAAAQGRHGSAVPQLLSVRSDVAEEAEPRARQAGALQQYVLRRVRALAAHQTARRRAPEIIALLAGARRVTSDSVQVARRAAPVACPELVDVNRVVTCFIEDRLRHPVPHDPPEEAVRPATTPGPGGGAADSSGDGADIHRYSILRHAGGLLSQRVRLLVAR